MRREDLKTEFNALVPGRTTEQGASRRAALTVALGAGYAAAARPIMAQRAIRTSSEGLKAGEASYQVSGFAAPAGRTHLPVLGLYVGQDGGIPLTTINQMNEALVAAAAQGNTAAQASEFVVFLQAGHAFHADYRPSHRKEAAEDGFKHVLARFKAHSVA
jgi:dienelactone hydrolase